MSAIFQDNELAAPLGPGDREEVIDLFNHYIAHTFAAYPEDTVGYEFFDLFLAASRGFPSVVVRDARGSLLGFGMLRPHNPIPSFSHTAEVTCFVRPEMTGQGIGSRILRYLEEQGGSRGISCLLASISSRNTGSIRFHERHGFVECGRFLGIGKKKGVFFDTVWMEKYIGSGESCGPGQAWE